MVVLVILPLAFALKEAYDYFIFFVNFKKGSFIDLLLMFMATIARIIVKIVFFIFLS